MKRRKSRKMKTCEIQLEIKLETPISAGEVSHLTGIAKNISRSQTIMR